jgi:hypothetical protein
MEVLHGQVGSDNWRSARGREVEHEAHGLQNLFGALLGACDLTDLEPPFMRIAIDRIA